MRTTAILPVLVGLFALTPFASAESPYKSSADFAKYAQKLRESALTKLEPSVEIGTTGRVSTRSETRNSGNSSVTGAAAVGGRYPWKLGIVTTVFWVGEKPTKRNPTPNWSSSWDVNWKRSFGGYDNPDPAARRGYIPAAFTPQLNPFYFALPYNDTTRGTTKPEVSFVVPWYRQTFERPGKSILNGRWIAIRKGNRVAYAQWSDCGPFRTDHWQYVFGKERPKPNINGGAGLDVSPAVRDYLQMSSKDVCDWKFVEFSEVPNGPWARYGDNNHFVMNARKGINRVASKEPVESTRKVPNVYTRSSGGKFD